MRLNTYSFRGSFMKLVFKMCENNCKPFKTNKKGLNKILTKGKGYTNINFSHSNQDLF
jgi:hypothetical protein